MSSSRSITPTEALLKVARSRPYFPAVRCGSHHWSYAALWSRVRQLSAHLDSLDDSGLPVGLYAALEVDYVAGAHAIWLSGRTVVFLNPRWSTAVLNAICARTGITLMLYGQEVPPAVEGVLEISMHSILAPEPPAFCPAPLASDMVEKVPEVASIIPGCSDSDVPRSIVISSSKACEPLSAESSAHFRPRDAQWLHGSSTSIRPLFEIRRFMFNQSTLQLDSSSSVDEQCAQLFLELESSRRGQPLRVHFTSTIFRAFNAYVHSQTSTLPGWTRVYWVVLEGEQISTQDVANARELFPQATVACDFALSEMGFAGAVQSIVRPEDPVLPAVIGYTHAYGCQDLVLLDDAHRVLPNQEGVVGVIGIVMADSGAQYLADPDASAYTFRGLSADHILLYTETLGQMTADGLITLCGRRDGPADLADLELALAAVFGSPFSSVSDYALVRASAERLVLFYTGAAADLEVLKDARDALAAYAGPDAALAVAAARHVPALPLTAKVALAIADEVAHLCRMADPLAIDAPLALAGLNSITAAQLFFWLQGRYDYDGEMHALLAEGATPQSLAKYIVGDTNRFTMAIAQQAGLIEGQADDGFSQNLMETHEPVTVVVAAPEHNVPPSSAAWTVLPNPLSSLFVWWITPLMRVGSKRQLTPDDLYNLNPRDQAKQVERWADRFWKDFDIFNAGDIDTKKQPGLYGSLWASGKRFWFISGLLWFIAVCAGVAVPLFIQQVIIVAAAPAAINQSPEAMQQFQASIKQDTGGIPLFIDNVYALAGILMGLKVISSVFGRSSEQLIKRLGLDVRTALSNAVYQKSLRLSANGLQKYSKGYILNLANVDAESVSKAVDIAHLFWSIPFQIIVVVVLLDRILGVSVWAGVGALGLALILLIMIVPVFMVKSAPNVFRAGDRRMKLIKEVLQGIKLLKIRGWENMYLEKVEVIRAEQLRWLRVFNIGVTCFVIIGQFANVIMPVASLSLFGDEKGSITTERIFPAISFFGLLVDPLLTLPQALSAFNMASVSFGRIYEFLIAKETTAPGDVGHAIYADPIRIIDGAFTWPEKVGMGPPRGPPKKAQKGKKSEPKGEPEKEEGPKRYLDGINMSIKQGSLTAVVGTVGSGKSSLLSAILGEMQPVEGRVYCSGSVAYCPQQPWIQSSTVQDNILFGKPMDIHQLEFAIKAANFHTDLERFPYGVASEIAENGNNLSGGQKARLSLARAVYANADLYVLDDPLAALDPRVSRLVFQKCILEALHGKTRVLVTQQLQYLKQVDHIIVVSQGGICEQGSYGELLKNDSEFKRMMSQIEADSIEKEKKRKTMIMQAKAAEAAAAEKAPAPAPTCGGTIIAAENVGTGSISAHTWWSYIKAMGGIPLIVLISIELLLFQSGTIIMNQWLTWWANDKFNEKLPFWIGIYDGVSGASVVLLIILNFSIVLGTTRASRNFHSKAIAGLINAPMWWFDSQPTGRIMNRFGKDLADIDQRLLPQLFQMISSTGATISAVAVVGYSAPILLALVGPLLIVYFFILNFYRKTLRQLKRLEATERSPLQSQLNETLDGIPTIAAYKREHDFAGVSHGFLDRSNKPIFLRFSAEIWLTLRMELLSSFLVFTVAMLAKTSVVKQSELGVALSYASSFTYILNMLIKSVANIESEMNSVERILEYTEDLPKEPPLHLETDPLEGSWPIRGEIVFKNLEASYPSRPERPVLRDVNIKFTPGETVFIVGRTGSGKSTLLSILLRLLEIGKGRVEVDGEDISKLGVATLRRAMELIPQDPFIFSGTIRTALDAEDLFRDSQLWEALEHVGMRDAITLMAQKLDTPVSDNGSNFSVGQRQLLCLAAALLRNPKILLLDEATSSLDAGADVYLLKTVRANCPKATVLSVMHRLSDRILEQCDKVLVMEEGVPVEFDSPKVLLDRHDSMFSRVMEAARHS